MFHGTGIIISDSGKRHLGSALGSDDFVAGYVRDKVTSWVSEIEKLAVIAISQPQAAFAAFTHVFLHRWSYLARTTAGSPESFHLLDDVLSTCSSYWEARFRSLGKRTVILACSPWWFRHHNSYYPLFVFISYFPADYSPPGGSVAETVFDLLT